MLYLMTGVGPGFSPAPTPVHVNSISDPYSNSVSCISSYEYSGEPGVVLLEHLSDKLVVFGRVNFIMNAIKGSY